MINIAIIFYSGYGHTAKQAESIYKGTIEIDDVNANLIEIDQEGNVREEVWKILEQADAIIFGSPTYIGGPAWQFKKFVDATSKIWLQQPWKDKVAAGFTNSGAINGDKFSTISYFWTFAMQHSMIWISSGILPSSNKNASRNDINWLGSFHGVYAQSPNDSSPNEAPVKGDLETARLFAIRVVNYVKKINK